MTRGVSLLCHPERRRGLPSRHPERSGGAAALPCHPERSEAESKDLYVNFVDIHIEIPRKARDDKGGHATIRRRLQQSRDDKSKNIFHSP